MSAFLDSLPLALVGMSIVFAVLSIIALFVRLIQSLDARWQVKEREREESATLLTPTIDHTTLVLISAAVAAALHGTARVRSVRRLLPAGSPRSAWALQGRAGIQGSHAGPRKRDR